MERPGASILARGGRTRFKSLNSNSVHKSLETQTPLHGRFFHPKDCAVEVKNPEDKTAPGKEEEVFFFAEGTCEGGIISGEVQGGTILAGEPTTRR